MDKVKPLIDMLSRQGVIPAVILVTAILTAYAPCFSAQFLSWDDPGHVRDNYLTAHLSWANVQTIFTTLINKTYIPLTTLSFAIERALFGSGAFVHHVTNVLLHAGVSVVLFVLAQQLGLSRRASFWAALIFGLHPLHVESVAWITERKDVLFGLFYLLAIRMYVIYVKNQSKRVYTAAVLLGLLSILSKPMALSLPLALFLVDWLMKRKFDRRAILDKLPFVLLIDGIALITYLHNSRIMSLEFPKSILIFIWTMTFYIKELVWPFELGPVRLLPRPVDLSQPEYITAVAVLAVAAVLLWRLRKDRWFVFAAGFYAATMFFLWRYDYKDVDIVAERFMYIPMLGFCFWLGYHLDRLQNSPGKKLPALAAAAALVIILFTKTLSQSVVWQNDGSLWRSLVEQWPKHYIAYDRLALHSYEAGQYEQALQYARSSSAIDPSYPTAYYTAALNYQKLNDHPSALREFNNALSIDGTMALAYYHRGRSYAALNQFEAAIADFKRVTELDPAFLDVYSDRGVLFARQQQMDKAFADFNYVLSINPRDVGVLNNLANLFRILGRYDEALRTYEQVLALDPKHDLALKYRTSIKNMQKGRIQ